MARFVTPISEAAKAAYMTRFGMRPDEAAGLVGLRFARTNGALVGVYHAGDAGYESDPTNPWATVCEDHSSIVLHGNRALAESHAADPEGWCEPCRSTGAGPG